MKSLGFAKSLMKDLEIAANFSIRGTSHDLLQVLRASDHVQVGGVWIVLKWTGDWLCQLSNS